MEHTVRNTIAPIALAVLACLALAGSAWAVITWSTEPDPILALAQVWDPSGGGSWKLGCTAPGSCPCGGSLPCLIVQKDSPITFRSIRSCASTADPADNDSWSDPYVEPDLVFCDWDFEDGPESTATSTSNESFTYSFEYLGLHHVRMKAWDDAQTTGYGYQSQADDADVVQWLHICVVDEQHPVQDCGQCPRDSTAPSTPTVTDDGVHTAVAYWLHATWTSEDSESGISEYRYAITTSQTAPDASCSGGCVVPWTSTGTTAGVTKTGLSLSVGQTYYFHVKARNRIEPWGDCLWSNVGRSDGITVIDPDEPRIDRGLPTTNINDAAGALRCNIRWANPSSGVWYGDEFTLPAGDDWAIERVTVWTVPEVPMTPTFVLGDHYASVALYGGPAAGAASLKQSGQFIAGTNATDNSDIHFTSDTYGSATYQAADGGFRPIWRVDFVETIFWTVTGGVAQVFGVRGVPRVDRLWFNHATANGSAVFREFDISDLSETTEASGAAWFGGKGSDINVRIYACPTQ